MEWEKAGSGSPSGGDKKKKGCLIAVVVVLSIILISVFKSCDSGPERISWPSSGLAMTLPEPKNPKGEIHSNSDEELWVTLEDLSLENRDAYIEECRAAFAVDAVSETSTYKGFNEDGCKLDMSFFSDDEISIHVYAPVELGGITWPTVGPASQVPAPSELIGNITDDRDDFFGVYLGAMDASSFKSYATAIRDAGYTVDYTMNDKLFSGKNVAGYSARLSYEGNEVARLTVDAPDGSADTSSSPEATPTPAPTSDPTPAPAGDTSFRTMVDEYEAFMNSYVDFMVKYQNSDDALGMAIEYAQMLADYGTWTDKMAAVDESALSAEDSTYFLEAQNRVNQRLLEVA